MPLQIQEWQNYSPCQGLQSQFYVLVNKIQTNQDQLQPRPTPTKTNTNQDQETNGKSKIWPGIPPWVMSEVNKDSTEAFTGDSLTCYWAFCLQLVDSTQNQGVRFLKLVYLWPWKRQWVLGSTAIKEPGIEALCVYPWGFQSQLLTPSGSKVMPLLVKGNFLVFLTLKIPKMQLVSWW